jgi:hypothetical protein
MPSDLIETDMSVVLEASDTADVTSQPQLERKSV